MILPYRILERKRAGLPLTAEEVRAVVRGTTDGSWTEGQLGAFLMAAAIRGMDAEETRALTLAMLESGERWNLAREVPGVCDKHSTGGVGDKISLILGPLLASCGVPVAMLTGRGLGHTAGTMDKLETLPGLDQQLDRARVDRPAAPLRPGHRRRHGRDRARRPPSLCAARRHGHGRFPASDHRQHPLEEAGDRRRGRGLRRQDGRRRLPARARRRPGSWRGAWSRRRTPWARRRAPC